MSRYLFTSESVSEGHPDKVADQISDAILDAMLEQDPHSRVACETMVTTGQVVVAGEITSKASVDIQRIVRDTIADIGYEDPEYGFDYRSCGVLVAGGAHGGAAAGAGSGSTGALGRARIDIYRRTRVDRGGPSRFDIQIDAAAASTVACL